MLIEQQPAFVLHTRPYRETSLLLECLSRDHGRVGIVARGVRSQRGRLRRSQLEPFQPLLLDLQMRGELATLRAAELAGPLWSRDLLDYITITVLTKLRLRCRRNIAVREGTWLHCCMA